MNAKGRVLGKVYSRLNCHYCQNSLKNKRFAKIGGELLCEDCAELRTGGRFKHKWLNDEKETENMPNEVKYFVYFVEDSRDPSTEYGLEVFSTLKEAENRVNDYRHCEMVRVFKGVDIEQMPGRIALKDEKIEIAV
jgi:hypothetical protein